MVVCPEGIRQRFLRGMITHDLVQRGLDFDRAYAIAHSIRDRLADREEVSTSELRDLILEELDEAFGSEVPEGLREPSRQRTDIRVLHHDQEHPFSRGLLARSVHAAGVDLDRAYRLITRLESDLRREGEKDLTSNEIVNRVGSLLEEMEDKRTARRYRLTRRIHHLPRPLVVYIGGASGTGKSTLALELAPLLRIYRITATDTIRQVMRMLLTPSILPALHNSTFDATSSRETIEVADIGGSDHEHGSRLLANYREQATRVCVGVRAVVERAIAENISLVVEGVHLHPEIVPFPDLEGAAYQVPLFLVTLNEEAHRARFLARARTTGRLAERYLDNFSSIRTLHDDLLQQIEALDHPFLDTSTGEPATHQALRFVTGVLEREAPFLSRAESDVPTAGARALLLIIDGLADRPVRTLGGRTPLQAARTPTLDRLAKEGQSGLADAIPSGGVADTAAGTLALFGQSPLSLRRGPVEAIGAGFVLAPSDIALRGNLAWLDEYGAIADRRAGRIREGAEELAAALDKLKIPGKKYSKVTVRVRPATEHRLAIVLQGKGLSSNVQGSDPGEGAIPCPPLMPRPRDPDDPAGVFTAGALAAFEEQAHKVLAKHPVNVERAKRNLPPANTVLTRGAGRIHRLLPLEVAGVPLRLACISGDRTVLGLSRWLGSRTLTSEKMTANLDTDLEEKFATAQRALDSSDLVILHVKGADIAAHDRRPEQKAAFLEKLDAHLAKLVDSIQKPTRIAVASDHATLSESGQHAADPLPVLVWGDDVEPDSVKTYDEHAAAAGSLGRFPLQRLLSRLFPLS